MERKLFECAICKKLFFNNVKGEKRFIGNRKDVRLHLRKEHQIKPLKNPFGIRGRTKKEVGQSEISRNCILYKTF